MKIFSIFFTFFYLNAPEPIVPKAPISKRWALGWHKQYDPKARFYARKRLAQIEKIRQRSSNSNTGNAINVNDSENDDDSVTFADVVKSTPGLRWLFRPKY